MSGATKRVICQAGHAAAYPPFLAGGGGAEGEALWTTETAGLLAERLRTAGVQVDLVGAWLIYQSGKTVQKPAPTSATKDADLFLALHYDADLSATVPGYNTGCFAGRAANDPCAADADRFIALWEASYPAATGIPLHRERLNVNVTDYYAFRDTTAATPGVLIECGVGQGLDHATLFDRRATVVEALARVVLDYLGISPAEEDVVLTDQQKDMLSLMEPPLNLNGDSVRQLVSDKSALEQQAGALQQEIASLHTDLANLADQLANAPIRQPTDIASVRVRRRNGTEEEISA